MSSAQQELELLQIETDAAYVPRQFRSHINLNKQTRDRWTKETQLSYPAPNGYNDPLSNLLIIDTLLHLVPGQIVRAKSMKELLQRTRKQITWDAVTIGRALSALADESREEGHRHFRQGKDRHGNFFVLDTMPEAYQWLHEQRDYLSVVVKNEFEIRARGLQPPARCFSVWDGKITRAAVAAVSGFVAVVAIPGGIIPGLG